MTSPTQAQRPRARHLGRQRSPLWSHAVAASVIVLGAIGALWLSPASIELLREQLHIGCVNGPPGSEAEGMWVCSDGIGYLMDGVFLGGVGLIAVGIGVFVAIHVLSELLARRILFSVAAASVLWAVALTWIRSSAQDFDTGTPAMGAELWHLAVGPASVASAVGLIIAFLGLVISGPISQVASLLATATLLFATALQPGLGMATVSAAGLLCAAAIRTTPLGGLRRS